ncbi:MAG: PEPxxWA-CTERM sorting domain-containing protein [Pontixanthobacter sp.]
MKYALMIAAGLAIAPLSVAQAATTVTAEAATNPYSGPTPTYDFSTVAPIVGGEYRTGNSTESSQPFGTDNPYYAVGPALGTPAVLTLSQFANVPFVSLSWGSVDTSNTLEVLGRAGEVLATVTGTQIQGIVGTAGQFFARGALVRLTFDGGTEDNIGALRFSSRNNSFEIDNIAVAPVPEPGVWAMMLLGFAMAGFSLRRKAKTTVRVRYA